MFPAGAADAATPRVLVFTKTAGYRHASIPAAIQAVRELGTKNGFEVDATENDTTFNTANLARYDAVVFLLTTGDVLNDGEQAAFESYIRAGGGYVGVHSAADTERDWPWYGRLVGAWSSGHPEIQQATIDVLSPRDDSTAGLPFRWTREDEWYGFLTSPRANGVRVLLSIDEASYQPREWSMGADHPLAWEHAFDGGRAWYTELGHTEESYGEPLFVAHLLGGIRYALTKPVDPKPPRPPVSLTPAISSLTLAVSGARVTVRVRYDDCSRCRAALQIRGRTVRMHLAGALATGTSAALPAGRWRLKVVLTDGKTGSSRTASRWVRIP